MKVKIYWIIFSLFDVFVNFIVKEVLLIFFLFGGGSVFSGGGVKIKM